MEVGCVWDVKSTYSVCVGEELLRADRMNEMGSTGYELTE